MDALCIGDEYLFVATDFQQLTSLRAAGRAAAEAAGGEDRRLLDRITGRVDMLRATRSEFFDDVDSGNQQLLN